MRNCVNAQRSLNNLRLTEPLTNQRLRSVPVRVRRPLSTSQTDRFGPLIQAHGADAAGIERVPRMAAFRAEPSVIGSRRPFASRTANERISVALPAFYIFSNLWNRSAGHKTIIGEGIHTQGAEAVSNEHRKSRTAGRHSDLRQYDRIETAPQGAFARNVCSGMPAHRAADYQRWLNKNQITMRVVGTPNNHARPYFIFPPAQNGHQESGNSGSSARVKTAVGSAPSRR